MGKIKRTVEPVTREQMDRLYQLTDELKEMGVDLSKIRFKKDSQTAFERKFTEDWNGVVKTLRESNCDLSGINITCVDGSQMY